MTDGESSSDRQARHTGRGGWMWRPQASQRRIKSCPLRAPSQKNAVDSSSSGIGGSGCEPCADIVYELPEGLVGGAIAGVFVALRFSSAMRKSSVLNVSISSATE